MTPLQPTPASPLTAAHPKTLVVAINPAAAFGASRTVGMRVVAALEEKGHHVTALIADDFAQLRVETEHALRGALGGSDTSATWTVPDALVVVGGDGMVSLGTALVASTRISLGIIPCGTGNDLARGLGLPLRDVSAAIEVLCAALETGPRVIDAVTMVSRDVSAEVSGYVGGDVSAGASGDVAVTVTPKRWFAGVLSAGFDAAVNERANLLRYPRGRSRYVIALLVELVRLTPREYTIQLDGVEFVTKAVLVSVGNNVSIGGGMRVTPNALLDDGLLDVLVVTPLSRLAFLRIFPRVFAGTHLTDARVTVHSARHVRVESQGVVAYADGERVGELPVDMEVQPGALRVLAP
jgi:diacylglycerol kinase (ATP)